MHITLWLKWTTNIYSDTIKLSGSQEEETMQKITLKNMNKAVDTT